VPPKELNEVLIALDSLIFLDHGQQLGYPVGGLFYKAKIDSESGSECGKSQVQHGGELLDSQAPVFLHGSKCGHNIIGPLVFFLVLEWR
jgi:hypothetical protein